MSIWEKLSKNIIKLNIIEMLDKFKTDLMDMHGNVRKKVLLKIMIKSIIEFE